ncbi:GRAM domain-containing protein 1B [Tupaia chinensis]|uniref:GRAM domain-containing protein 1B n=1 Tax=Tupaia chinensis TaxID=246437 RepID=L9KXG4_TUPCH|nr:GRAM domain-containing protein 1B [Tupaia chinensis]
MCHGSRWALLLAKRRCRVQNKSTASNSNRSTPACSPILRKRSRSPTPQNQDGDAMVEKGSDHSSDKSPSTPEQGVQRSCSSQSGRSGGKNSKGKAGTGPVEEKAEGDSVTQSLLRGGGGWAAALFLEEEWGYMADPEYLTFRLTVQPSSENAGGPSQPPVGLASLSEEARSTPLGSGQGVRRVLGQPGKPGVVVDTVGHAAATLHWLQKSQSWYNVLSPTYKQRNEDFRKLFKQLPDTERLIVDYSCALQRDILLQGRLYLSENWICFYSNIFRWETLLTVRLKDICSMTKEKTARLIPNAIQVCTDSEKPLCPKELWHFVHQCYGNELGLTSDDEDYVPPDDDFNTMGYCEEIPVEENEVNDSSSKSSIETKPDASPQLPKKSVTNSTLTSTGSSEAPVSFDGLPLEEEVLEGDGALEKELAMDSIMGEKIEIIAPVNSPSLDFNDNEDIPTELSDSSDTHDEGEVQAFYEDLSGRQYVNEVFNFSVDKLYDLLFTNSPFQRDFMEQRRFSDIIFHPWKKEENGNQSRVILYTITLTNPLAPKTATVRETQTLYKASQESECYVIDAEVLTHDVPYHDYFYTINRYTLTRVARNKSRLRVSTELRYRKQPWGLVKTFIEKNFWSGLEDYFRHLESELAKTESTYLAEMHRQSPKEKAGKAPTVRRRKRPHAHLRVPHLEEVMSPVTTPTDEDVGRRIKHVAGSTQTRHVPEDTPDSFHLQSVSKLLLVISCVICFRYCSVVILSPHHPFHSTPPLFPGTRGLCASACFPTPSALSPHPSPWLGCRVLTPQIRVLLSVPAHRIPPARWHAWVTLSHSRAPSAGRAQGASSALRLLFPPSLVLLVVLNMMLFYKLWMLEHTTQTLTAWQGLRLQERLPQSQTEWAQLLESQQKYHDTELQKWRESIRSSVMLLDQMKDSLINLQNGIRSRDYTSESEEKRNRYH